MQVKVEDLEGDALDWAVAEIREEDGLSIKDFRMFRDSIDGGMRCSSSVAQSWPIIHQERIAIVPLTDLKGQPAGWGAGYWLGDMMHGPDPLVQAMRVYVRKHRGPVVEIPDLTNNESRPARRSAP